jgi:hypothetical protein
MLLPSCEDFEPLKTKKILSNPFLSNSFTNPFAQKWNPITLYLDSTYEYLVDRFGCRRNKNKKAKAAQKTDIEEDLPQIAHRWTFENIFLKRSSYDASKKVLY